jgi:hypothetical protein
VTGRGIYSLGSLKKANLTQLIALSKGPKRVSDSLPSSEEENGPIFPNVVFLVIQWIRPIISVIELYIIIRTL